MPTTPSPSSPSGSSASGPSAPGKQKKPVSWFNVALGAGIQTFEISTLGQPFEVIKTHMAAHRQDGLMESVKKVYKRGGVAGFYQGLIPWAWIESTTKGAALLYASSEVDHFCQTRLSLPPSPSALIGGMGGGIAQAYTTMGFCTFMKTVEVTRHKSPDTHQKGTIQVAKEIFKKEGIVGMNKGVTAVAVRQMTNWGGRFGISRFVERLLRKDGGGGGGGGEKLSNGKRILASLIGGSLACWNQPIEVIRVEMQSQTNAPNRPSKMTILSTARYIYNQHGVLGFYRGVTPRICLSAYLTVLMVAGGDSIKEWFAQKQQTG